MEKMYKVNYCYSSTTKTKVSEEYGWTIGSLLCPSYKEAEEQAIFLKNFIKSRKDTYANFTWTIVESL